MTDYRSLNHTKWACQYHVVFIPKYRKKVIYTELRRYLGDVLRRLAQRRESEVEEGHLMIVDERGAVIFEPVVVGGAGAHRTTSTGARVATRRVAQVAA